MTSRFWSLRSPFGLGWFISQHITQSLSQSLASGFADGLFVLIDDRLQIVGRDAIVTTTITSMQIDDVRLAFVLDNVGWDTVLA